MIPAEFEYLAPSTLEEAAELLGSEPGAKLLAGGMSLIPAMKHRLATPATIIDLGRVEGLDAVRERRGRVEIGAMVAHEVLERGAGPDELTLLRETAAAIGDRQVRARGTMGGSLVHADPAADWPAAFLALDGEAVVRGPAGERTVPASEFFTGMLTTALGRDEILTAVRLPFERKRAGSAYLKVRQPASGFAIVGVAVELTLDRRGCVSSAGIGVTGVNAVPFRARGLEARLVGEAPSDVGLRQLCGQIEEADPMQDVHASAEYRRHLASVYARRAILRAHERASA